MLDRKYIRCIQNVFKIIENERADAWTIGGHLLTLSDPESLSQLGVDNFAELISEFFPGYPLKQAKRCVAIRQRLEGLKYNAYSGKAICKTMPNTRLEALLPYISKRISDPIEFLEWADTIELPVDPPKKTYRINSETQEKINFLYRTEEWTKGELLENLVNSYLDSRGHLTRDGKLKRNSARVLKAA